MLAYELDHAAGALRIERRQAIEPGTGMAYKIDPRRDREVVDEFRHNPIGQHSPNLQRVLNTLRGGPLESKYVLVCTKPHREWVLARHPGARGQPIELLREHTFESKEEAEWAVFRLRWQAHTGEELN